MTKKKLPVKKNARQAAAGKNKAVARGAASAFGKTANTAASQLLALKLKAAVDKVSTAIMMVDRNLVVNYVNDTTRVLLSKNVEHFRKLWPGFNPESIEGTCIDMFHKNPAHQRGILADPKNFPYRTDIEVGPLRFSLCVNASFDLKGNYVGNMLEWADVTEIRKREAENADLASQMQSISNYQVVVEFRLDGTIVGANENFLRATGYSLSEIAGKHHSMFVDPAYRQSQDYRMFWDRLARGEADSGQYRRIRKDGTAVWLQASYNPILDIRGKPCKIVKYATDITEYKIREEQMAQALAETARVMKAVEAGDLRESMEGSFVGEFASLQDTVNACVEQLRNVVGQIRHSMSTLALSATEIATGNMDLSQRTEEQGASLTTTAANMEQITATVTQNAASARAANKLALGARQQAESGGSVVASAITAMSAINQASKGIADIIGVIDDIAFQTNLLALNAAVEAARAGEQGRGFAVVAAEVRNLAQRSAGAAKEIKALIKDSVSRVEEGSRLVNESGSTLDQIVTAAKQVSDIISEIAVASSEQSAGIVKISEAIAEMDSVTQQNSALVEQTSAASNMMDEQTRRLSALLEFFKIEPTGDYEGPLPKPDALHKARQSARGNSGAKPRANIVQGLVSARRPAANAPNRFESSDAEF